MEVNNMEEKDVILTQEGYDNLDKELNYLKTEKRAEIADRIKVALGFGDLSENSEYDEAKTAQAENEVKIAELENKIRHAKIIDESEIDTDVVQIGNTVKVLDMEFDEEVEYTIVVLDISLDAGYNSRKLCSIVHIHIFLELYLNCQLIL